MEEQDKAVTIKMPASPRKAKTNNKFNSNPKRNRYNQFTKYEPREV